MNLRHCPVLSLTAAALVLPLDGIASTCRDELNRFESRLQGSSLATDDPQLFEELLREAERAAELRDEQQCLQRVAELNEELPGNAAPPSTGRASRGQENPGEEPSRPKAPVLLATDSEPEPEAEAEEDDLDGTD